MYLGYLKDKQENGFNCVVDTNSVQQLLDFNSTLNNLFTNIIENRKKGLFFSKEIFIFVLTFLECDYIQIESNIKFIQTHSTHEIHRFCATGHDNPEFFNSPNYILEFRGGADELTIKEKQKLLKSVLSKTPNTGYSETSINKLLKKALADTISDKKFWELMVELVKLEEPQTFKVAPPITKF